MPNLTSTPKPAKLTVDVAAALTAVHAIGDAVRDLARAFTTEDSK